MILFVKEETLTKTQKVVSKTPSFSQKKISLVEAFIMLFIALIADAANLILILIGMDDWFVVDTITAFIYGMWFHFKGGDWSVSLRASMIESIPYLGVLPFYLIFVSYAIYHTNHPEKREILTAVVSKGKTLAKKVK